MACLQQQGGPATQLACERPPEQAALAAGHFACPGILVPPHWGEGRPASSLNLLPECGCNACKCRLTHQILLLVGILREMDQAALVTALPNSVCIWWGRGCIREQRAGPEIGRLRPSEKLPELTISQLLDHSAYVGGTSHGASTVPKNDLLPRVVGASSDKTGHMLCESIAGNDAAWAA